MVRAFTFTGSAPYAASGSKRVPHNANHKGQDCTQPKEYIMNTLCATRAVKVLKYLHRTVPKTVPRSSLHALEELPPSVLAGLHTAADWDKVTDDALLKRWLADNPIPAPKAKVSGPLFNGTLVFAQVSFTAPGLAPSGISAADTQTAISYATLAVVPIQWYASQYGSNSVSVWPVAIPFTARVQDGAFSESEFEGWVDDVAQFMRSQQVPNPCIVIMHNRSLPNSPAYTNQRNSYHSSTSNGTPYCYTLVFGENLSIADNNHTVNNEANENVYAHTLSHEIAEMVVDPRGDDSNPEVCDGCATNCNASNLFDLFDQSGAFMGGATDIGSASGFAFFISSIVRSDVALDSNFCVAPGGNVQNACIYPPPLQAGQLLSYGDDGTPGNVSDPAVVGFGGWLDFQFLFSGTNVSGENRIYAVNQNGQLLSYADAGTFGNVSDPVIVGFGGWSDFKYLFSNTSPSGERPIYAVNQNGELLSYADDGALGNVSDPVIVGFGGWLQFKFLFTGTNLSGENRIYAVNQSGELLSYADDGTPGNVSDPVIVGFGGWLQFKFLFSGRNLAGENRIYGVNQNGELLSYADNGAPGNVSDPVTVGFGGWLQFKFLFTGTNLSGEDRIYAVVA